MLLPPRLEEHAVTGKKEDSYEEKPDKEQILKKTLHFLNLLYKYAAL